MLNGRVDGVKTVGTAVIVVVGDQWIGDLPARIDTELEIGAALLIAIAERALKAEQGATVQEGLDLGVCFS